MKCSDIPDSEIFDACRAFHGEKRPVLSFSQLAAGVKLPPRVHDTPEIALAHKYPAKLILAKMRKLCDKGLLDYGVSLRTAWVVEEKVTAK